MSEVPTPANGPAPAAAEARTDVPVVYALASDLPEDVKPDVHATDAMPAADTTDVAPAARSADVAPEADTSGIAPGLNRAGKVPPQSATALLDALGGKNAMLDSAIPGAVFVAVYVITRELSIPLWTAGGVAAAFFLFRLVRRDPVRSAVSGFIGVAIAAGLALLTGKPENYFLPTLVLNVCYAVPFAISLLVRWPLLGAVLGTVFGEGTAWRQDPARRRAYTRATAVWLGMFLIRISVLYPLYLAGLLVPLGVGRIALGFPLYALVIWVTWLIIGRTQPVRPDPAKEQVSSQEPEQA